MKTAIKAVKPQVLLSVALPSATPELASKILLEEWDVWLRDSLVDFVVPMLFIKEDKMLLLAGDAVRSSQDRPMYVAIGTWQIGKDLGIKQIGDVRALGASGVVVYSYNGLMDERRQDTARPSDLAASVFAEPASVPTIPAGGEGE